MATYIPLHVVPLQFVDSDSTVMDSGTLEFYDAGTSNGQTLFSDNAGTSIGTSITLNARGLPESGGSVISLWRDASKSLKIVVKDSGGATISTTDNLPALGDALFNEQTLSDGATISWDLADGSAKVTLGGNRTLAAPTNMIAGRTYGLRVTQDGSGSRLISSWNAVYQFAGGTAPTLTTTAGATDVFLFYCDGTNMTLVASALNVS